MNVHPHDHSSTPATLSLMPSSRLNVVEEHISSTNAGRELMRSTMQSFLEFLDRHYHNEGINTAYKEIIRICIAGILSSGQSETTMVEENAWDSSTHLQAIFNASKTLQGQLSNEVHGHLFQEFVNTLPEEVPPFRQFSPDLSLPHNSGPVSYELGTQPFQSIVPEMGTSSEGQIPSGSLTDRHQSLHQPITQGGQEKMRCMWPGCSSILMKDNHTRHVDETHLRKVKAVCNDCGKLFQRTYMKKNHVCRGPLSNRKSF